MPPPWFYAKTLFWREWPGFLSTMRQLFGLWTTRDKAAPPQIGARLGKALINLDKAAAPALAR
jgi:hypothetical protein